MVLNYKHRAPLEHFLLRTKAIITFVQRRYGTLRSLSEPVSKHQILSQFRIVNRRDFVCDLAWITTREIVHYYHC